MKILVIDDERLNPFSGKTARVVPILKGIATRHELHLLLMGQSGAEYSPDLDHLFKTKQCILPIEEFSRLGRYLNFFLLRPGFDVSLKNPKAVSEVRKTIVDILQNLNIDVIHVFSFFGAQFLFHIRGVDKIWDLGDSYYLNVHRGLGRGFGLNSIKMNNYALRLRRYEHRMISDFDRSIFVSKADASIHGNLQSKLLVVPNGVDVEYFAYREEVPESFPSIVFSGHMNFPPNIEAALYFAKEIFPLILIKKPEAKFFIVGAEPCDEIKALAKDCRILVTGRVDDIRDYIARGTIFVAPMVSGAGIKNKVLQAMSMGKPVVSTSLGVEAIDSLTSDEVAVADGAESFSEACIELLNNSSRRMQMGHAARKKVENDFGWSRYVSEYFRLYDGLGQSIFHKQV